MRNRKQNSIRRWKNRMRKSRRGKTGKKEENSNTNKNNKKRKRKRRRNSHTDTILWCSEGAAQSRTDTGRARATQGSTGVVLTLRDVSPCTRHAGT